jgi:hypothetical protein
MEYQPLIAAKNEIRVLWVPRKSTTEGTSATSIGWHLENVSLDDFTQESRVYMSLHQVTRFTGKHYLEHIKSRRTEIRMPQLDPDGTDLEKILRETLTSLDLIDGCGEISEPYPTLGVTRL